MADINEDCLVIYHYKPPLLNCSLETALDNVLNVSRFEFGDQNGFCLNFVPYVRNYLVELERDNVLSNPMIKHFNNRICGTSEDNGWRIRRFERYRLMTKGLNLLERGHLFNKESIFDETFFEKKLITSQLSRQQYEKWKIDAKETIELLDILHGRDEFKVVPVKDITEIEDEAITKIAFELYKDLRSMKRMENGGYGSSNEEMDWD